MFTTQLMELIDKYAPKQKRCVAGKPKVPNQINLQEKLNNF